MWNCHLWMVNKPIFPAGVCYRHKHQHILPLETTFVWLNLLNTDGMLRKTTDGRLKRECIELTLKIAASSLHFTKIIDLEMCVYRKSVALTRSVPSLDGRVFPSDLRLLQLYGTKYYKFLELCGENSRLIHGHREREGGRGGQPNAHAVGVFWRVYTCCLPSRSCRVLFTCVLRECHVDLAEAEAEAMNHAASSMAGGTLSKRYWSWHTL